MYFFFFLFDQYFYAIYSWKILNWSCQQKRCYFLFYQVKVIKAFRLLYAEKTHSFFTFAKQSLWLEDVDWKNCYAMAFVFTLSGGCLYCVLLQSSNFDFHDMLLIAPWEFGPFVTKWKMVYYIFERGRLFLNCGGIGGYC